MKVNLKQLSKNFISVKIHALKKVSVAKLCSGIRRYFMKYLEIDLFYLIVESIIRTIHSLL